MPRLRPLSLVLLASIVLLAAFLRLPHLRENPPGFFCDEADIANNAAAIWKTGRDTHGLRFPVFFPALGDYKNPVPIYSSVPFVVLLGKKEIAVRLMAALYGCAAVVAIFLLASELFDPTVGLWAALLLAVSPWHVHLSRIGMEFSPSLFWITFALYACLRGLRQVAWYVVGAFSLIVAVLSYYTPWLYGPPILLALLAIHWPTVSKRWLRNPVFWYGTLAAIGLLAALVLPSFRQGSFFTRWHSVRSGSPSFWPLWQGYWNHFSANFLFRVGDAGMTDTGVVRHSIVGMGELYWFELPLLLAAPFAWIFWPKQRRALLSVAAMLAFFPLGTIFTTVSPYATRSSFGAIALTLAAAVGLRLAQKLTRSRHMQLLVPLAAGFAIVLGVLEFRDHSLQYPIFASGQFGWQDEGRQSARLMIAKQKLYDKLYLTHQINAGEALRAFFFPQACEKCGQFPNPIVIAPERNELFFARPEDVLVAKDRYPKLHFFEQGRVYSGGGDPELVVGTFSALPPLPLALGAGPEPRQIASPQ